jgi:hypothetical protein
MVYELDGWDSIAGKVKISVFHSVQTGSVVYSASYPVGTGGFFPMGKAAGV